MRAVPLVFTATLLVSACSGSSSDQPDARPTAHADAREADADTSPPTVFGGDRPVTLQIPSSYTGDAPTPLVIALHGYYTSPDYIISLFGLDTWYEDAGFLFIHPHGSLDASGNYYWNATDACCDLYGNGVDDSSYLAGLITDISASYNVDPKRIYILGHSNGAFMAYRMACDHADLIAGVISVSGATFATAADCTPSEPVSVVELHGTADGTILYGGGQNTMNDGTMVPYPSAATTVATWAGYDGCDAATQAGTALDLSDPAGDDTTVDAHTGCPTGIDTELWSMDGVGHVPLFANRARQVWWSWFQAHPKP